MNLLTYPDIQALMTDDVRRLQDKANTFFTLDNIKRYLEPNTGFVQRGIWSELGDNGLLGVSTPTQYGGHGMPFIANVLIKQAMMQLDDNGLSLGFHVHNNVGCVWLESSFNEAMKQQFLPLAVTGEKLFCTGYTETDKIHLSTAIEKDDMLCINAKKSFVINGANADICMLTLDYNQAQTTLLVEKPASGIAISKFHDRLGNCIIDQVDLVFTDVNVTSDHILSKGPIQRLVLWNKVMTNARFFIALDAYCLLLKLQKKLTPYAKTRYVQGKLLGDWGIQRDLLQRLTMTINIIEQNLRHCIHLLQQGKTPVMLAAKIKYYAVENTIALADQCCEAQGGYGYMLDGLFTQDYLQALGLRFASGSQTIVNEMIDHHFNAQCRIQESEER
jgi:alkylation response protein AidB-like acyl-CoA dehydrogenase